MEPNRPTILQAALPLALLAALFFGSSLTGCGAEPTATPTPTKTPTLPSLVTATPVAPSQVTPTPTPTPTPTHTWEPTSTPTTTPTPKATSTPTLVPLVTMAPDIDPLTGLKVDPTKLERRPLGIKIPNYPPEARPQSGLSLADVVVEHEAEAYLTRFTAIFLGNDVQPELGPIRSIRLIDAELMPIFKSVLVTSGGHMAVKLRATEGKAWAEGYKRIICPEEPFLGDGGALRRIPKEGRRLELTMYGDTESLWKVVTERGVNGRQDFRGMWVFSEVPPQGGTQATTLKIVYKPDASEAEYRYDSNSNTYKRFDLGQPLMDALTDEQIAPTNVLVLYANHVDTDIAADTHDPNHTWYSISIQLWGSGPAKLLRDGQVYEGNWVREDPQGPEDRLIVLDGQGKQIPFRPGTTWIQLVRLDGTVEIK
jgi:hypothetical protein